MFYFCRTMFQYLKARLWFFFGGFRRLPREACLYLAEHYLPKLKVGTKEYNLCKKILSYNWGCCWKFDDGFTIDDRENHLWEKVTETYKTDDGHASRDIKKCVSCGIKEDHAMFWLRGRPN